MQRYRSIFNFKLAPVFVNKIWRLILSKTLHTSPDPQILCWGKLPVPCSWTLFETGLVSFLYSSDYFFFFKMNYNPWRIFENTVKPRCKVFHKCNLNVVRIQCGTSRKIMHSWFSIRSSVSLRLGSPNEQAETNEEGSDLYGTRTVYI